LLNELVEFVVDVPEPVMDIVEGPADRFPVTERFPPTVALPVKVRVLPEIGPPCTAVTCPGVNVVVPIEPVPGFVAVIVKSPPAATCTLVTKEGGSVFARMSVLRSVLVAYGT
jgi:hypothetical protein